MNILFVYNHLILPWRGGTERVAFAVGKGLEQAGHKILYLSTDESREDCCDAISSEYVMFSRKLTLDEKRRELSRMCIDNKIDVIINEYGDFDDFSIVNHDVVPSYIKIITCLHLDVYGNIVYFRRQNHVNQVNQFFLKKFIVNVLSFLFVDPYRVRFYLRKRKRMRKMLLVSDAVVVPNKVIASQLARLTGDVCNNVYDIFNPVLKKGNASVKKSDKRKTILYVGRFSLDKNVDHIVKAWGIISDSFHDWNLKLVGDGETFSPVASLIEKENIPRVTMCGCVENVIPFYREAQYVVLASDCESWSCVVQEALMYGCFPIVYDYPSASFVIPNRKWAIRVSRHSERKLADAIKYAIENKCSNVHNLKDIYLDLERCSIENIVKKWENLLQII